jgi:uncharacterized membrane protein YgdD (TMEM256/DUF423 family)
MGALAVVIGAFGAHALEPVLESNGKSEVFETAVKYHFYHVLAALLVILIHFRLEKKLLLSAAYLFLIGILLFSGSLYLIALGAVSTLGAITPVGGLFFILGWILMGISFWNK